MDCRILSALIVLRYLEILSRPGVLEALTLYSKGWLALRILWALIVLRYLEILSGPRILDALNVYNKGGP